MVAYEVTPEAKAQPHEGPEEKHSRERDKCRRLMFEGVSGAKRAEDQSVTQNML